MDPPQLQDGRVADHPDAGERHRVPRRGRLPSPGSRGDVGPRRCETQEPRRRRRHRQRLRAGTEDRGAGAVAAEGRRTRGDAQQVRALRRPPVTAEPAAEREPRRVLFVTGKLAEPALRRTLAEMAPAFSCDVAVMKITVAAVNHAPRLPRDALRREAEYYRASGADVIDIGCTPGRAFPALAEVVRELLASGMRVSIDSFEPAEIRAAVGAGAELVLSVNGSNLAVARDLA